MGKRKRRADPNKTPTSDLLPHSSQMDALSQQESSPQVQNNAVTPISSILELVDDSVNLPKSSQLPVHQHHFSRAMILGAPRHYSRKYSRRNTGSRNDISTSDGKVIPSHDEKVIFKLANKSHSDDSGLLTESLARVVHKPDRIRLSPLSTGALAHDAGKMCGICERLLRKKPLHTGNSISPGEPSVVAVLVCGHLYHADCLEQKTCQEERMDPSCPLCQILKSKGDAEIGQK